MDHNTSHLDHYGAIQTISRKTELAECIHVNKFVYWFPDEFGNEEGLSSEMENANNDLTEICKNMNVEAHRPARDEKFKVDGIEICFLYVPDDCSILNTAGRNLNLCSLIFTVSGKNKRAMITGDAYGRSMQVTAWRYANKLKCDILQMPHHALCDAYCTDFYNFAEAEIVLMPVSVAGYHAMHTEYATREGGIANLCVEAKAKEVYKAFEGTAEIMI